MTLQELIDQYRSDNSDTVRPYLSSDDDLTRWFNEAEEEAALRANLIHDTETAEVCQINVVAGTSSYDLHESVFQVTAAFFTATGDTERTELVLTDRIELSRVRNGWRAATEPPTSLIVEDTKLVIGCLPEADGLLEIECYRAPLTPMAGEGDIPEIGRAHHRHLGKWVEHRAFARPDSVVFDKGRSDAARDAFTRQFGERPDADMRRSFKANRPASNKAYW